MLGFTISAAFAAAAGLLATASALPQPQPVAGAAHGYPGLVKRCGGCGGWGGIGGFGFPFATSATTDFNRCASCANFNDNTLFTNHKCANCANDNVHAFTNANVVA